MPPRPSSVEGRLTKHVPSMVCENQKRLCATNMRATTRPYNSLAASPPLAESCLLSSIKATRRALDHFLLH